MMTLNDGILNGHGIHKGDHRESPSPYRLGALICPYPSHSNSNGAVCWKTRRVDVKRVRSDSVRHWVTPRQLPSSCPNSQGKDLASTLKIPCNSSVGLVSTVSSASVPPDQKDYIVQMNV